MGKSINRIVHNENELLFKICLFLGKKSRDVLSHFSSGFIMWGPAPGQMGPVGETHRGVLSLGETSELWALAHHQLIIKGVKWYCPEVCSEMFQRVGGSGFWLRKAERRK